MESNEQGYVIRETVAEDLPLDTVYLNFNMDKIHYVDAKVDLSRITCKNVGNRINLKPRVIKSGPNYLFMYKPAYAG